jgi:hypothetical protein
MTLKTLITFPFKAVFYTTAGVLMAVGVAVLIACFVVDIAAFIWAIGGLFLGDMEQVKQGGGVLLLSLVVSGFITMCLPSTSEK